MKPTDEEFVAAVRSAIAQAKAAADVSLVEDLKYDGFSATDNSLAHIAISLRMIVELAPALVQVMAEEVAS